jgi:hypothetical protein|uniref:Uncharacterized protein n=1 Tax=viral metagenome TaxID=1070528 RepID=A0A6C0EUC0_9ZZZZ
MGLSNAASRARNYGSTANRNQGGGSKKAGFAGQVGRGHWTSRFLHSTDPKFGNCCNLKKIMTTMTFTRNTIRPIGIRPQIHMQ